jgi:hypothetical protein
MHDQMPADRGPLFEVLLFVPSSFLMAWFLAGFSIRDLWEIAGPVVIRGWPVAGVIAGGLFVWIVVRIVNWHDTQRATRHQSEFSRPD